jgi:hypothetical protein
MCKYFNPNFGDKKTGCCITTTHRLTLSFSPGKFSTKATWLLSALLVWLCPLRLYCFPDWKAAILTHFNCIKMAVLNTLTEHDFQYAFKKLHKRWELLRGCCWPLVSYDQMAAPVPEFMDTHKKLHGLSPQANYTDRATAACRLSDCQLLRIEGATWSAWRIPQFSRQEPLLFYP